LFPVSEGDLTICIWTREDLDILAGWPGYPFPYQPLNLNFSNMNGHEKDAYFTEHNSKPDELTIIADYQDRRAIGWFVLVGIVWSSRKVRNMGVRIAPSCCDKGIGTRALRIISQLCFDSGFEELRLDVAACNLRAIRCYQKAGFEKTGEFWQEEHKLNKIDLNEPRYDFLRPHVRFKGKEPEVKFWWMKKKKAE